MSASSAFAASEEPDIAYRPPPDDGLDLVHVDEALVLVNKPAGLLSVPGRGDARADCMVTRVQREWPDALIVHRLDMATSGLLLLARGAEMQRRLSMAFAARDVHKRYEAVLQGVLGPDAGEVDLPLCTDWPRRPRQMVSFTHGKPSLTRYVVLARDAVAQRTRVALEPVTGRSHQLRVHMQALGHAIVGDPLYGAPGADTRMHLHASALSLVHPLSEVRIDWHSPPSF